MIFVLFHLRRLNTIDLHSKTSNDHYNVFDRSVHSHIIFVQDMTYTMSMLSVDNKLADIFKETSNNKIGGVSGKFFLGG